MDYLLEPSIGTTFGEDRPQPPPRPPRTDLNEQPEWNLFWDVESGSLVYRSELQDGPEFFEIELDTTAEDLLDLATIDVDGDGTLIITDKADEESEALAASIVESAGVEVDESESQDSVGPSASTDSVGGTTDGTSDETHKTSPSKSGKKKERKDKDKDKDSKDKKKKVKKSGSSKIKKSSSDKEKQKSIDHLLVHNMDMISALCDLTDPSDMDDLTSSLFVIFAEKKRHMRLVKWAVSLEVAKTSNYATLFRGNTFVTKLISLYCKHWGLGYLFKMLDPALEELLCDISSFEIDPTRAFVYEDLAANKNRLIKVCQSIVDTICGSVDSCPMPLRMVLEVVRKEAMKKFPNMNYKSVGAFFFLRFVCPAIVAPDGYFEERKNITEKGRRGCVLASKLIQNLANELKFNEKEEFMMPLNPFIDTNLEKLHNFFDALVTLPPGQEFPEDSMAFNHLFQPSIALISRKLIDNREKIAMLLIHHKRLRTILEKSTSQLLDEQLPEPELVVKREHQLLLKGALHKELTARKEEISVIRSERRKVRVQSKLMHAELIKKSLKAQAEREEIQQKQTEVVTKKKSIHTDIVSFFRGKGKEREKSPLSISSK